MKKFPFRISSLITTLRIISVAFFAIIISFFPMIFGLIPGIIIIFLIFLTDTLDGIMARKLKEESKFGAFYDIVGDRVTEIGLLVPFVFLNIITPVLLTYFLVRGYLTDYHRFKKFSESQQAPFKQIKNPMGKFLVASPFMRQIYVLAKVVLIEVCYIAIFIDTPLLNTAAITIPWVVILISILRTIPAFLETKE